MSNRNHPVREIAPGTRLIDEFGLDCMYLLEGTERALLIDAGTGVGDLRGLVESLTDLPYDFAATHSHQDHIGGCAQFDKMWMHPEDDASQISAQSRRGYAETMLRQYPAEGSMPYDLEDIQDGPLPEILPLRGGQIFSLGERDIEVIEIPGHTPGSVAFLDRKNRLLILGDAIGGIILLVRPDEKARVAAVRAYREGLLRVEALRSEFDAMWGGHTPNGPVDPQNLTDLLACTEGILNGTLAEAHKQIHVFDGPFYSYGTVDVITHDLRRRK